MCDYVKIKDQQIKSEANLILSMGKIYTQEQAIPS